MRFVKFFIIVFACSAAFISTSVSWAGELDNGYYLQQSGRLEEAAEFFCRYGNTHPNDSKNSPEALLRCARILDTMADAFTEQAEKQCYWHKGGGGDPSCMERAADRQNARFSAGSFQYEHSVLYISYTGQQYREILNKFPGNRYADEADFYLLLRDLVGHPDNVLPKVKAFLSRHPSGEWNRKGLLLWARVNEDIWHVHRKWSWVLFNYQVSPDELIVRAEPYRQQALKTYLTLMKEPQTFEGRTAAREYALLNSNQEDGHMYSIVNDSSAGTLDTWGIEVPSMQQTVEAPSNNYVPSKSTEVLPAPPSRQPQPAAPTYPSAPEAQDNPSEKAKTPQRWN